jgi:Lrp/AsnC family leucine-responsive transcriptional regulator
MSIHFTQDMSMTLDALDLAILRLLQRNNQQTAAQLAARIPLSPTAIQRRIRLLRERGIIEADVSIVSAAAVGRPFSMLVLVSLERERMDIIDRFKQAIRNTPEVMNGYYVTGETDFVLVITARDMNDYEAFTRRFFYENPDIKGFKTLVVMDRIKGGHQIPLG